MTRSWILTLAATLMLVATARGVAQEQAAVLGSYERARRTLERALTALRPEGRPLPTSFTVETRGIVHARLQSPSPAPPFRTQRLEEWIWIDLESDRVAHRQSLQYPDFTFRQRVYIEGNRGARVTPWSEGAMALPEDVLAIYRAVYRRIPPLVLEEARRRAGSLRWVGTREIDGAEHELISFAEADGALLTLYLNETDGLLTRVERLYSDPAEGDAVATLVFEDYHEVGGIPFPRGLVARRAGVVVEELEIRLLDTGEGLPEGWPDEMPPPQPAGGREAADTVLELAEDVYLLKNVAAPNYHVLAVGFDQYVLAMETPVSSEASSAIVARIREIFPTRPIRYAIPTHHHDDHSGGARAFIAAGATLVTTPGNRDFFRRMVTAERTIEPDALSRRAAEPEIETVDGGRRVFRDGGRVVEIIDVGPNPHAEEHLIAYLPREGLVFQGDLIVFSESGTVEPARPQGVVFARRLEDLGLEVERIAGVHGRVGTIEELERAVAEARQGIDGGARR